MLAFLTGDDARRPPGCRRGRDENPGAGDAGRIRQRPRCVRADERHCRSKGVDAETAARAVTAYGRSIEPDECRPRTAAVLIAFAEDRRADAHMRGAEADRQFRNRRSCPC